jgi:hypothetical protein
MADKSEAVSPEYEFGHAENLVIGSTANRARIFGILCAISGVLELLAAIANLTGLVEGNIAAFLAPTGVFNIVLGVLLTRMSTSMSKVVTTTGSDVTLMMDALENLGKAFLIQIVATVLLMVTVIAMVALYAMLARS